MNKRSFRGVAVVLVLAFCFAGNAAIRLPYFFADSMVLQQQTDAAIWGWAKAGATVQITTSWNKARYNVTADASGKWKTRVKTLAAGGPYEITISDGSAITLKNVLIGEVWLCSGQSNMEMPLKGYRDQPIAGGNDAIFNAGTDRIRLYTVPRSVQRMPQDTTKQSAWKAVTPEVVSNFSAVGYLFGKMLYDKLQVPIGLVNISYGGTPVEAFMDAETLKAFPEIPVPKPTDTARLDNKVATVLYNGMLGPFLGYSIKGCIWYQGESNNNRPAQYEKLLPAFVKQIREQSGQGDFAFYYCQIAPFNYANGVAAGGTAYNSANLRDAQRKALAAIPNSGMAVLLDVGEEFNIHPADKPTVSKRLAYMALAKSYGFKGFGYASPAFESMSVNGNTVTLKFSGAPNGLTSHGKPLTLFEVAGPGKVFRPARAIISAGNVVLSAAEIQQPIAVRYAYKDFVVGELFNTEGFPVSSFRTDDW